MALCVNANTAYKDFQMLRHDRYFVDKTAIIEKVSERIKTKNRFLCITKPRRFRSCRRLPADSQDILPTP